MQIQAYTYISTPFVAWFFPAAPLSKATTDVKTVVKAPLNSHAVDSSCTVPTPAVCTGGRGASPLTLPQSEDTFSTPLPVRYRP